MAGVVFDHSRCALCPNYPEEKCADRYTSRPSPLHGSSAFAAARSRTRTIPPQVGNQTFLTSRRTLYIVVVDLSYSKPVVIDGSGLAADGKWGKKQEMFCLKKYVNTLLTHVPSCVLVLVGTKVLIPLRYPSPLQSHRLLEFGSKVRLGHAACWGFAACCAC